MKKRNVAKVIAGFPLAGLTSASRSAKHGDFGQREYNANHIACLDSPAGQVAVATAPT